MKIPLLLVPTTDVPWVSYHIPPDYEGELKPFMVMNADGKGGRIEVPNAATGIAAVGASSEGRRLFEYVAVWSGKAESRTWKGKRNIGTPRWVMYSPYDPRRKGKLGPYRRAIPALLCDSPQSAAALAFIYDLLVTPQGPERTCRYCRESYVKIRSDQTTCGKGKCQVAAHRWRLAHPKPKRKRRK